jgi:hypothetical protein
MGKRASTTILMILGLSVTGAAQQEQAKGVPEYCRVTIPSDRPFVPPPSYETDDPNETFSYGTDALWTRLPVDGTWRGLPHYTPNHPSFRQKLIFGRLGYDPVEDPQPPLTVTGRRLDTLAPPLTSDRANNGWVHQNQPFMVTGINLPTLGCWEITGHYKDQDLTFVIWVTQ